MTSTTETRAAYSNNSSERFAFVSVQERNRTHQIHKLLNAFSWICDLELSNKINSHCYFKSRFLDLQVEIERGRHGNTSSHSCRLSHMRSSYGSMGHRDVRKNTHSQYWNTDKNTSTNDIHNIIKVSAQVMWHRIEQCSPLHNLISEIAKRSNASEDPFLFCFVRSDG